MTGDSRKLRAEIDRTGVSANARVIFLTAGPESPLPRKLPAALLALLVYREEESWPPQARPMVGFIPVPACLMTIRD